MAGWLRRAFVSIAVDAKSTLLVELRTRLAVIHVSVPRSYILSTYFVLFLLPESLIAWEPDFSQQRHFFTIIHNKQSSMERIICYHNQSGMCACSIVCKYLYALLVRVKQTIVKFSAPRFRIACLFHESVSKFIRFLFITRWFFISRFLSLSLSPSSILSFQRCSLRPCLPQWASYTQLFSCSLRWFHPHFNLLSFIVFI